MDLFHEEAVNALTHRMRAATSTTDLADRLTDAANTIANSPATDSIAFSALVPFVERLSRIVTMGAGRGLGKFLAAELAHKSPWKVRIVTQGIVPVALRLCAIGEWSAVFVAKFLHILSAATEVASNTDLVRDLHTLLDSIDGDEVGLSHVLCSLTHLFQAPETREQVVENDHVSNLLRAVVVYAWDQPDTVCRAAKQFLHLRIYCTNHFHHFGFGVVSDFVLRELSRTEGGESEALRLLCMVLSQYGFSHPIGAVRIHDSLWKAVVDHGFPRDSWPLVDLALRGVPNVTLTDADCAAILAIDSIEWTAIQGRVRALPRRLVSSDGLTRPRAHAVHHGGWSAPNWAMAAVAEEDEEEEEGEEDE